MGTFIPDFEGTFDTHPRELLKSKIFCYGIGGETLKWKGSFLCYRKQQVIGYGETSGWAQAGVDKSKICPLVHWVGKIFFHLPSGKTCLPSILFRHHLEMTVV